MDKNYKGVVWTDHALQRLRERNISQSDAWYVFRRPDRSRYARSKGAWIYYKDLNGKTVEVVAKKDDSQWVIISVWTGDAAGNKQASRKHSLLTKFLSLFSFK